MKRLYEDTDEVVLVSRVDTTASELQELISEKEANEPKDKRQIIWKNWKHDLNLLMKEYNEKFGKIYSLLK